MGESGSGKTTVGLALLGHARKGVRIAGGTVEIGGADDARARSRAALRSMRGGSCRYVPQDPSTALNPALRIGTQVLEVLEHHGFGGSDEERRERVAEVMREVALPRRPRVPAPLPAPAVGRPAAARRPGDGVRLPARGDRARRADHRARRHDAGARARDGPRACRGARRRGALRQPRPRGRRQPRRPGRGDVRRADRRAGPDRDALRRAAAPVHRAASSPPCPTSPATQLVVGSRAARRRRAGARRLRVRAPLRAARSTRATATFPPTDASRRPAPVRCLRGAARRSARRPRRRRGSSAADATTSRCSVRGVDAGYSGLTVVHDVDLDVARGECLALVGESGSGKTTLARSIGGSAPRVDRRDRCSTASHSPGRPAQRPTAQRLADPVRVPEPVQLAQPAPDGRRDRRAAATSLRRRAPRTPTSGRRRDARAGVAHVGVRASLPRPALAAASGSASRSPGRW